MNKKLGLLLIPLVPFSAIGVVSIVNRLLPVHEAAPQCVQPETAPAPSTQPVIPPAMPKG